MTWTQSELDALKSAYASGTLRVSYDGKSVEYGSEADLIRRIRTIEREIAVSIWRARPASTSRPVWASTWMVSRSRRASTSGPRPSTGGVSTGIREARPDPELVN